MGFGSATGAKPYAVPGASVIAAYRRAHREATPHHTTSEATNTAYGLARGAGESLLPGRGMVEALEDAADLEHSPDDRARSRLQPKSLPELMGVAVRDVEVVDERRVDELGVGHVDDEQVVVAE